MSRRAERALEDLQSVLAEIESLFDEAAAESGGGREKLDPAVCTGLTRLRARVSEVSQNLTRDVKRRVHAADDYVHDNAWALVGAGAAAAFLAGLIIGRREPPRTE